MGMSHFTQLSCTYTRARNSKFGPVICHLAAIFIRTAHAHKIYTGLYEILNINDIKQHYKVISTISTKSSRRLRDPTESEKPLQNGEL